MEKCRGKVPRVTGAGGGIGEASAKVPAVLHGSGAARNAPYPRRNLCDAFEVGAAKFGHPVKDPDANLGFGFLIFERACLGLVPDDGLPAAHLRLNTAALIVAG